MKQRLARAGATVLLFAAGCSGNSTVSAPASPAAPTRSTAPPAGGIAPAPAASPATAAAIVSIDCGTAAGSFTTLAEAWGSQQALPECETLLNRKHEMTRQEQQAVKTFKIYATDVTALTALDVLYGICASKDAEPRFYEDTHPTVLRATLMLCPDAPHADTMRAKL